MTRRAAFAALLCLALVASTPRAAEKGRKWRLTILHFNDIHGHLEPWKPDASSPATVGGIARMAALVEKIRKENRAAGRATLLLEAGDVLTGTPMSSIYRGEPDVDAFDLLKVDAMAFGNHEFDFGREQLGRLVARARFPVLGANIYAEGGRPFAPGTAVLEPLPGFRVGVIGLTTADAPSTTTPANVAGLAFDDPVAVARHAVPVLERECDLVVALTHIGLPEDKRLAETVPGVDAVVGGHTHLALETPERVGTTPIVQAGDNCRFLGRLDLTVADGRVTEASGSLIPIVDGMPEDAAVAKLVSGVSASLRERLSKVVGRSSVLLDGARANVRSRETTFGDFVADRVREAARAEVAIVNGGSIRASVGAGNVTYGDLVGALPFENRVLVAKLPGKVLRAALDRSAAIEPAAQDGGFLQVSGVRFAIEGGRATDVVVAGEPLSDERVYAVAMPAFLVAGGDGYTMLAPGATEISDPGLTVDRVVSDYFAAGNVAAPAVDGRILRR